LRALSMLWTRFGLSGETRPGPWIGRTTRTVALFTDAEGFGGAEIHLLSLAERLDRSQFHPCVVYSPSPAVAPLIERLGTLDVEAIPVPPMRGVRDLPRVGRLAALLRRRRIDVFHAHKPHPAACRWGLLAAVVSGCRGVLSTDHSRPPLAPARRQVLLLRCLSRLMHGHIAISRGVKSYLVATLGFRSEKVWVMPNWVDPVRFAGGTERVEMRKRLGVSDGTVIVGMVARFDDPKGHGDLVAAARSLVRRYPPIVFVLVGDGATRPAITAQVVEGGLSSHFRFLGQRNDVSALLDAFDIPQSPENVLLVQVSASIATLLPLTPAGIGTEQAFLLYVFRGAVPSSQLLAFSVGLKFMTVGTNVVAGFTAIALTMRTLRYNRALEQSERAPET